MVKKAEDKNTKPTCFVIMPISTPKEYEDKHFDRVYEHLIKPACEPEYAIIRADEVRSTNYIIIDVLNRIIDSDLVICDLSSRNPNVLYELGIRQAFNLPVVLLKDKRSDRIFDIQGLRTVDYDDTLRIDIIKNDIDSLKGAIKETSSQASKDINSLIQLLGVKKAELSPNTELSPELSLILGALQDISQRINRIENRTMGNRNITIRERVQKIKYRLPNGEVVNEG
ncbi:MAG: hypothetical protein HQ568_02585 [Calditrichaeota bacterium]|nr:hypothetical protein [Calditrichota bacterium]